MAIPNYRCNDVQLQEYMSQGSFGSVYKGILRKKSVAVKVIDEDDNANSVKEVERMRYLDHPNVIKLLGIVPSGFHYDRYCVCEQWGLEGLNTTWLILQYMPNGDLLDYVTDYTGGLPASEMIRFAYEIALGMYYLHKNANIVHGDLAARNILLNGNNQVKIADFGMCNGAREDHYYDDPNDAGYPCPLRWMPPENFPTDTERGHYTRKGDVWSYGVVLYEIWSRGCLPFRDLSDHEVMSAVPNGDTVLDHDNLKVRFWVRDLMEECFEYEKSNRPNFRMIYTTIEENM